MTELLRRLLEGELFKELRESPMQFVGYANAELATLEAIERSKLLQALLVSLEGYAVCATSPTRPDTGEKTIV